MDARRLHRRAALFVAVGFASACSGSGSFSGKVDGRGMGVNDAIFALTAAPTADPNAANPAQALTLILSTSSDRCGDISANQQEKNEAELVLEMFNQPASGAEAQSVTPGSYAGVDVEPLPQTAAPSSSQAVAWGLFVPTDNNCDLLYNGTTEDKVMVSGGTVALQAFTAAPGGTAKGTFNLKFGPQNDAVSGDFTARYCAALATQTTTPAGTAAAPTCH